MRRRDRPRPREDRGGRAPRAGRPPSDPARQAAYEVVAAVHRDDAYANLALPMVLREYGLVGRDAAFATELAYGTLRALGTLDAVLAVAAQREVARIDPPVRDALRLGAYQLLHTRVPAHAAVSSTVDLVRAVGGAGASGFANAVLRRVAAHDLPGWLALVAPAFGADPVGHLALAHSHPQWIVRAFADALGGDLAETAAALAADNERPEVHLCARPGLVSATELAEQAGGEPGRWSPYSVVLGGGSPGEVPAVAAGRAHVQDEGSQLVAVAAVTAPVGAGPDGRWLDLCAGPGGKAGLLGALAAQRGARVTAVEVAPHRAQLVTAAVRGLPVDVVCADGRTVSGEYDRVLVDAPCTGLGALRRRPEARWRRAPSDLPPLTSLQRELLGAALGVVRPGGVVAYATCSPHLAETRAALRRLPASDVEHLDARRLLPEGMPDLGDAPAVQLWPHRHGTDAMFLAVLRRSG
ncbi:MAG TPA: transcription antitermination factor NusB [Micromonosporaceae bacterium]|nr:transcription antitermination factor NusB [Micromonosporaceae bacterium]